ncbi:MAG: arginine--tRNA ligase [Candidatus Pacebacteria bacterium]|nr:arginine--tRNA ligase [Candidatus Paceibacterota bacterium]MCF7856869.1 arginine--tRNA ligase [Candidatus Paceibacterota bacterium]
MEPLIRKAIENALEELGITGVLFAVEHPAEITHGDYSTNVAMVCAKKLGKSPHEIAEQFREVLEGKISHVDSVSIAGSGFINFHLTRDFFSEKITDVNTNPETFGKNDSLKGENIIFEYTSPNLFKPLHIGNLVGNIVGESISRLFEYGGATLNRVNYPSDIGLTVAKGVWGLQKTGGDPKDINQIGDAYRVGNDAYEHDPEAKEEIEFVNRSLYLNDNEDLTNLRAQGIETSRARLADLCRMLGTTFDTEIFESEVSALGTKIVRENIGKVFEESNGAVIFRGEKYGFHTRVFLNSQGLPTYEAKDVGNFAKKQEKYPDWTQTFVVTGGEQREYFKVLIAALREVFPDISHKKIEHIPTGFLTLTTGKMSSRKGNVLTGESLIAEVKDEVEARAKESRAENVTELTEQVSIGALKYQILRQSVGSDIVFDKERALSLEGDSGPYLMYTHARISSIEEKAHKIGMNSDTKVAPSVPYEIEKLIYQFPEVIVKAQTERAPHYVVTYLTALASSFNSFYAHEKIIDNEDMYAPYKLAVASSVKNILRNGLWVLGMKAPEKM